MSRKVGIVCCSNGQDMRERAIIDQVCEHIRKMGFEPILSPYLYAIYSAFSGTGKERAKAMMDFYLDEEVVAILDISGGDAGNMVLSHLDYDVIGKHPKPYWGYSDLTTVLNAIYSQTGNEGVLYQIKNIVWDESQEQLKRVQQSEFDCLKQSELFDLSYHFLRGESMEGIVVGGNIRCLLKLAGTKFWPDFKDKILLLEGRGGGVCQYGTYLAQLEQTGVFDAISGIMLGTFTEMEEKQMKPTVEDMLFEILDGSDSAQVNHLPVIKTKEIGHGVDANAIVIGRNHHFVERGNES